MGEPWYLATCRECKPILPQPFRVEADRDQWAFKHEGSTGHTVARESREIAPTFEELADEAEAGYDPALIRPLARPVTVSLTWHLTREQAERLLPTLYGETRE